MGEKVVASQFYLILVVINILPFQNLRSRAAAGGKTPPEWRLHIEHRGSPEEADFHSLSDVLLKTLCSCRRKPLRRVSLWNGPSNGIRHFITLTLFLVSLDKPSSPTVLKHLVSSYVCFSSSTGIVSAIQKLWMCLVLAVKHLLKSCGLLIRRYVVFVLFVCFSFPSIRSSVSFHSFTSFVLGLKESLIATRLCESRCPPTLLCHSRDRPLIKKHSYVLLRTGTLVRFMGRKSLAQRPVYFQFPS